METAPSRTATPSTMEIALTNATANSLVTNDTPKESDATSNGASDTPNNAEKENLALESLLKDTSLDSKNHQSIALPVSSSTEATDETAKDEAMHDAANENGFDDSARRSKRRSSSSRSPSNKDNGPTPKKSKCGAEGQKSSKSTKKEQELLDMAWICVACKEAECAMDPEAEEFLVCEGPCRRLFHVPCAGLARTPSDDTVWKCHDCQHGRHVCGFCQEYGQDGTDVFKCQKPECGMFFHESCLQMQNIPIKHEGGDGATTEASAGPPTGKGLEEDVDIPHQASIEPPKNLKFTCPSHWCWTCTQEELKFEANQEESAPGKKRSKGRRGSKNRNNTSAFAAKKESRLFQCLECPTSYHITCIPPMAKFHELALLCHEHAEKQELPALELENSLQGSLEAAVDKKLQKVQNCENLLSKRKLARRNKQFCRNPFFPAGVVADKRTTSELKFLEKIARRGFPADEVPGEESEDENAVASAVTNQMIALGTENDRLLFCLSCDIQEEVYSKPPPYKHIHSLKYYSENRPKRIPLAPDTCSCVNTCDDHCFNRLLYAECFGSKDGANGNQGKVTNCSVGPDCGNRRLGQRQSVKKCMTQRERGKGWGLVTMEPVKAGQLVQEYLGDVIDEATKEERLNQWTKEHPNDPNFYIMCLSQGWYIDAREQSNLARFINHSCDPNCVLLRFNVGGYMRNGIFALRDIKPGEFLSYDYHFDTQHGDKFVCRCGSANCRGTMKEKNMKKEDTKKSKAQLWDEAKQQLEKDKQFLQELDEKQKTNSIVQGVLPGTMTKDGPKNLCGQGESATGGNCQKLEWVSNGVQDKDRTVVVRSRIFLWRNAVIGSDFASRCRLYTMPGQNSNEGVVYRSRKRIALFQEGKSGSPASNVQDHVDVLSIFQSSDNAKPL